MDARLREALHAAHCGAPTAASSLRVLAESWLSEGQLRAAVDALILGAGSLMMSSDTLAEARDFLRRAEQVLVQYPAPDLSARVRIGWATLDDHHGVDATQMRADYRLLVRAGQWRHALDAASICFFEARRALPQSGPELDAHAQLRTFAVWIAGTSELARMPNTSKAVLQLANALNGADDCDALYRAASSRAIQHPSKLYPRTLAEAALARGELWRERRPDLAWHACEAAKFAVEIAQRYDLGMKRELEMLARLQAALVLPSPIGVPLRADEDEQNLPESAGDALVRAGDTASARAMYWRAFDLYQWCWSPDASTREAQALRVNAKLEAASDRPAPQDSPLPLATLLARGEWQAASLRAALTVDTVTASLALDEWRELVCEAIGLAELAQTPRRSVELMERLAHREAEAGVWEQTLPVVEAAVERVKQARYSGYEGDQTRLEKMLTALTPGTLRSQ